MKMLVVARFVSVMAVAPMLLSGQMLRDNVPLRHWPAPLYWQPSRYEAKGIAVRPEALVAAATDPLVFVGMAPCRVVDTRAGQGFSDVFGPPSLNGNSSRTFPIQSSGTCAIPSAALAYSFNVTVVPPGVVGYITLYPTGQPLPLAATLTDVVPGNILSNSDIVPAGTNGSIDVYAQFPTDIVIDINGYYLSPAIGQSNTAWGSNSLVSNTIGSRNTALGDTALSANTVGYSNTATGAEALQLNLTGSNNTANGTHALSMNTTGGGNTAMGLGTLDFNTTGNFNTAIGAGALSKYKRNNSPRNGNSNIAVGYRAGVLTPQGGSDNIMIGSTGVSTDNATIRIGLIGNNSQSPGHAQTSFFAAGIRGVTTGNNDAIPVVIDSAGQLGTVNSSRRFKEDIQDMGEVSNGLMRLRPVTFRYQKPFADGSKPIQYGLIAEEVAEVYPDLIAHSADGQIETVKYQVLDSMLLNEVQGQQKQITALNEQNQALRERLSKLEAEMAKVAGGAGVQ